MPNQLYINPEAAASRAGQGPEARPDDLIRPVLARVRHLWLGELAAGILWTAIAVVVLKFDHASVVTVGVLTGLMFLLFAAEQFVLAQLDAVNRPLWVIFGTLLGVGGVVALIDPVSTFAGMADILGILFVLVGVQWMVQAFLERALSDLWWLTLLSGVLMMILGFWVSGAFFLDRAYTLLVFAGIWAAMKGVTDIVRALQLRRLTDVPLPPAHLN